jgi:hypothetical protein
VARRSDDDKETDELVADPPVVARLVVEIRSDGSRTIARGALEDSTSGQRTVIEARGTTPLTLAMQLAKAITGLSLLRPRLGARSAVRGLLDRARGRGPSKPRDPRG